MIRLMDALIQHPTVGAILTPTKTLHIWTPQTQTTLQAHAGGTALRPDGIPLLIKPLSLYAYISMLSLQKQNPPTTTIQEWIADIIQCPLPLWNQINSHVWLGTHSGERIKITLDRRTNPHQWDAHILTGLASLIIKPFTPTIPPQPSASLMQALITNALVNQAIKLIPYQERHDHPYIILYKRTLYTTKE